MTYLIQAIVPGRKRPLYLNQSICCWASKGAAQRFETRKAAQARLEHKTSFPHGQGFTYEIVEVQ